MTQKKYLDGKTWFPLTVQKEILAMRKDVENNVQHAGQKFEIAKQAYNEIREAHGQQKSKITPSCSGCILNMNQIIINWFKLYDKLGASEQRIIQAPKFQPLTPSTEIKEPTFKELLEIFNEVATPEEKKSLLNGRKTPKKNELIDFLNAKQNQTTEA